MRKFPVDCSCGKPALFKIAALWSDGLTRELKTYALCCEVCLRGEFDSARLRCGACRTAEGESIEGPYVFERTAGGPVRRESMESSK